MKPKDRYADLRGARVLLVDDDASMRDLIGDMLSGYTAGFRAVTTCKDALSELRSTPYDVALVDVNLPDGTGFDIVRSLSREKIVIPVVLITGIISEELTQSVEDSGVQTILTKPFSATQLRFSLAREVTRRLRGGSGERKSSALDPAGYGFIGISAYAREIRKKIEDFSVGNMPVLITGPTGTGKEIIAQSIHACSHRRSKPLMTVNSSAIPEHLEESEFFGYAKGAFTGAYQSKDGILRCADGTTLFLDEVGELSLRMQVKLLRVLDGHEFLRIGETRPEHSDFRLVSATNRSLQDMIKSGLFRDDLFFRLKAASIVTEPLSKHKEDIPALIRHFLAREKNTRNRDFEMTVEALEVMIHYNWPGNVRELRNTIESICAVSADTGIITRESVLWVISDTGCVDTVPIVPFSDAKLDFERDYYRTLLVRCQNNITTAAKAAGIERSYFSKRIKALGLTKENVSSTDPAVHKTAHTALKIA